MSNYENLADYYDRLMNRDVDYVGWANYLWKLLTELHPSPIEGLEMASGTGNMTEQMIRKNCHLDAFDRSEEMLTIAREKNLPIRDVRFFQQDMLDFRFAKKYDFAICSCDSINYLLEDGDLLGVFQRVFDQLKPGGIFLFDVVTLHRMSELYGNEIFVVDQDDVYYVWKNQWDPENCQISYEITFFVQMEDGYERFDEFHQQRGYTMNEIEMALDKAGFENKQSFDGFTKNPVTDKSERVQWRAQKGV